MIFHNYIVMIIMTYIHFWWCLCVVVVTLPAMMEAENPIELFEMTRSLNSITLTCRFANNGLPVNEPVVFYRNGLEYSLDTTCLQTIATSPPNNSMLVMLLTAECEGYFQCGRQVPGGSILSPPLEVNVYPALRNSADIQPITLSQPMYSDVELPCPFQVSALNTFTVTWQKFKGPVQTQLMTLPINDDYSTVLRNVTFQDAATYFCTITSIPFQSLQVARRNGPFISLTVTTNHVPPKFSSDLTFRKDANSNYLFQIQATGTDPLQFEWFLDNATIPGFALIVIEPTDDNKVIILLSKMKVNIETLAKAGKESLNLTVIVTNTDNEGRVYSDTQNSVIFIQSVSGNDDGSDDDNKDNDGNGGCDNTISPEDVDRNSNVEEILLYVLGILVLVSWVVTISLVVLVMCYKVRIQHIKNNSTRQNVDMTLNSLPSPSSGHPEGTPLTIKGDHRTNTATEVVQPTRCCDPNHLQTPEEWPNPISYILYKAAFMAREEDPTQKSFLHTFHKILLDVLEHDGNRISIDQEMTEWVMEMRDRVQTFKDSLQTRCKHGTPQWPKARATLQATNNETFQQNVGNMESDTDEPDGGVMDSSTADTNYRNLSNIERLLSEWLERARSRIPPPPYTDQQNPA